MDSQLLAICGVAALLVVGAGGVVASDGGTAFTPDRGPGAGYGPTASTDTSVGDGTGTSTVDDAGDSGAAETDTQPFTVRGQNTEKCGRTCRDVTSRITNHQDTAAADITVSTTIYAGKTADGNEVWRGSADVGTLEAGSSHTATKRIELSFGDAISVKRADGWVTIETMVETADQTVTLTEQRKVA